MSVFVEEELPLNRTGRKTKKKYSTKYNPKYREDFPWALPSAKGDIFAYCHFCHVDICIRSVGAKGLRDHALTVRHSQKCQISPENNVSNEVMQNKNVVQSFTQLQPLSNTGTHTYQNLCESGQLSNNSHMSNNAQVQAGHVPANHLSVESLKLQDSINPIDHYGFSLQQHDSRYATVSMGEDISNTVHVGASSAQSIVSQSPHTSSVTNSLYPVVNDECPTLQPLYSYPSQMHPTHGIRNGNDQSHISCDKALSQVINRSELDQKTGHDVLESVHGIFQSSQSSFSSGSSSSLVDKSCGLSVEDLTCNVCGTVFDNWMDLKTDLLLHIKHAQEQPKKKNKKHGKILKKTIYSEVPTHYPRRKGRPPGTKKDSTEDLNSEIEPIPSNIILPPKINGPLEETISAEDYYALQNDTVLTDVPPALATTQEITLNMQQGTARIEEGPIARITKKKNGFICRFCQTSVNSKQLLKDHLKISHNNGRPYECEICKKFFTKKSNLDVHKKHKHSGDENSCKCKECGKVLSTRTNLRIHLRIHEGKKPFACKECNKRFNRKANLEMHIVYHTGERRFTCEMCGKSFFAINALKRHRKLHTGERDHVCKECGSTYVTATDLRRHMLKHNDVKPFPCNLCEKQFTRSHDLKVHLRYHNKDHRFTCPECKKKFVESGNYRRHLRRHTGERPYACTYCFQTFTQVHHYKVHLQNQHKDGEECARNRQANSRVQEKGKSNIITTNVNSITNANISTIGQMVPHIIHAQPSHQHTMPNMVHPLQGSSCPNHISQSQPQITSNPSGVIQQYNYVYNSSMVPHYHTIFDVGQNTEEQ